MPFGFNRTFMELKLGPCIRIQKKHGDNNIIPKRYK